ncbi:MAG: hypothetical protein ACOCZ6_04590 [Nanoarchaeota archaeon]
MTEDTEKKVPVSFWKNYKKAMQDLLKRKEKIIEQLKEEKELWRKTALRQGEENSELRKKIK